MEKRAMLAFILSLMVLFGYQYLMLSETEKRGDGTDEIAVSREEIEEQEISDGGASEQQVGETFTRDRSILTEERAVPEKLVLVETDLAQYTISTRNAVIKEILLKEYKDESGQPIRIIQKHKDLHPLQMIYQGKPVSLSFKASQETLTLGDGRESGRVVMSYSHEDGSEIEKILEFRRDSYEVKVEIRENLMNEYQVLVGASNLNEEDNGDRYTHVGPVVDLQGDIERVKFKDVEDRMVFQGNIPWLAVEEKYFMTAFIPEAEATIAVADRLRKDDGSQIIHFGMIGKEGTLSYQFYAGPKDYELLKSLGVGLERIINFGVFGFLAKPIFYVLKITYRFAGNYGVAIILLTTLIKIIFIPLTHKQQKSMKEMQRVQPEMNAIREKFKGDQQRMSKEMMELYKKYKINPAAGCLPLVIQIPVFFALYNVLLNAIELRGAPFLYLSDLSASDSLFGHLAGFSIGPLPLLMGLSMYIQQKMMPSTMDPKQAKILQLMPLIFMFMFLNFPSGLVLYWLVNNLLTIAQQLYVNKSK